MGYFVDNLQNCIDEFTELEKRNEKLEIIIACAADLANTWAREQGIKECFDPYESEFGLRDLIDRIWSVTSQKIHGKKQ